MAKASQHLCLRATLGTSTSALLDLPGDVFPSGQPHGKALHTAHS